MRFWPKLERSEIDRYTRYHPVRKSAVFIEDGMNTIADLPAHHVAKEENQNLRGFVSLECFWGLCCFASISTPKLNC